VDATVVVLGEAVVFCTDPSKVTTKNEPRPLTFLEAILTLDPDPLVCPKATSNSEFPLFTACCNALRMLIVFNGREVLTLKVTFPNTTLV